MGSRTLVLIMILGVLCVAQALKCNYCKKIDAYDPKCHKDDIVVTECSSGLDTCIRIKMESPAYGEVRRCAKAAECDTDGVPSQVKIHCCDKDTCN